MRTRKRRLNGPERFARDFTALVAQEAMRARRKRICRPEKFVKWAEQSLRASKGEFERLAWFVEHKLCWLVYGAVIRTADRQACKKKALVFARRHRFVLAEQVLASNVMEDPKPLLGGGGAGGAGGLSVLVIGPPAKALRVTANGGAGGR